MKNQKDHSKRLKEFNKARTDFDDTVSDVAQKFGYSKGRIYDVLKYPNENPDLFRKIANYTNSAGYPFDDSEEKLANHSK